MKLIQKSLLVCLSLFAVSCTTTNFPSNNQSRVAQTVHADQLLGPWAVIGSNRAPQQLTNVAVLFPNKTGLRYTNTINKGTRTESQQTEFFTWTFDEPSKMLTQQVYEKHTYKSGGPRQIDRKNVTKKLHAEIYKNNHGVTAVKLSNAHESGIYSKLDDRKLEVLLKDNINVPELIR